MKTVFPFLGVRVCHFNPFINFTTSSDITISVDKDRRTKCNSIRRVKIFSIKTARNDQKIKIVMLATSEATFPVFFATRFTSQVPNVTEVRLFKCIHRITKQNFVNDIQSTYEDLLKNSEYYFSHENGMEGSGSFISAMLGTDDTNTNHLLM